jgi:hypothetical protein
VLARSGVMRIWHVRPWDRSAAMRAPGETTANIAP